MADKSNFKLKATASNGLKPKKSWIYEEPWLGNKNAFTRCN